MAARSARDPIKPIRINHVYAHLNAVERFTVERGRVQILWTHVPIPGCDLYAYADAFSFPGPTDAVQVLVCWEPPAVLPGEYTGSVWKYFDYVITYCDSLVELDPKKFRRFDCPTYQWGAPPSPLPTLDQLRHRYPTEGRRRAVCMVLGNKHFSGPGAIYTLRAEIARWFYEHSPVPFDAYGFPPFPDLPNYRGRVVPLVRTAKRLTLSHYRFDLCLENSHHPFWSRGAFSDRIYHALETRTIPIYLGCTNIEEYFPPETFIDLRQFSDYQELSDYLHSMSDAEYRQYIDAIDTFLAEGRLKRGSILHLYDLLVELYAEATGLEDFQALYRGETVWRAREWTPQERSLLRSPRRTSFGWWTWGHLSSAPAEECDALVHQLQERQSSAVPLIKSSDTRTVHQILFLLEDENTLKKSGYWYTYLNSFVNLEIEYTDLTASSVSYRDTMNKAGIGGLLDQLWIYLKEKRPDVIIYLPFPSKSPLPSTFFHELAKQSGIPHLVWLLEDPDTVSIGQAMLNTADLVVTHSSQAAKTYQKSSPSAPILYLPAAFSPSWYHGLRNTGRLPVSYIGRKTSKRAQLLEQLQQVGVPIAVFGPGWGKDSILSPLATATVNSESRIGLNLGSRRRLFEVPAAGSLCLTTPQEHLNTLFCTDEENPQCAEIVVAHSSRELVAKLRYYLRNESARREIAARGHQRAWAEHRWSHRLEAALREIGLELPPRRPGKHEGNLV